MTCRGFQRTLAFVSIHLWANRRWVIDKSEHALYFCYVIKLTWILFNRVLHLTTDFLFNFYRGHLQLSYGKVAVKLFYNRNITINMDSFLRKLKNVQYVYLRSKSNAWIQSHRTTWWTSSDWKVREGIWIQSLGKYGVQ